MDQDAIDISNLMNRLIRSYQFRDKSKICCYDITATEYYALCFVVEAKSMSINQISQALALNKSNASRAVAALEKKGYLKRMTDENDARSVRITVTNSGKSLYQKIEQDEQLRTASYIEDFNQQSIQSLKIILTKYNQHLENPVVHN